MVARLTGEHATLRVNATSASALQNIALILLQSTDLANDHVLRTANQQSALDVTTKQICVTVKYCMHTHFLLSRIVCIAAYYYTRC